MTITFETDNDVIIYALEKVIAYARRTQQVFVAQCVWWLASIIGLEQGLVIHIDNLQERQVVRSPEKAVPENQGRQHVHPDRVPQVSQRRSVSAIPRDLTEDPRLDKILESAEQVIQESFRDRSAVQGN
jgi:hypothetical protein